MAVLDATTLLLLIETSAKPPKDPSTGKSVERCKDRLEHLLEKLSASGVRAAIPTPVLSEILVGAGKARNDYLMAITSSSAFTILPFDIKAAVELSFLLDSDGKPIKGKLNKVETWAKVKFDRQIIAICKANGLKDIYSDDINLSAVAQANGLKVHHTWELPFPPQKRQQDLDLRPPREVDEDDPG